ncbi:response regulator transcription factor [Aneurinibacillus aneurinilyticus]|uniref:Response regulator ArlR n=1 Tax=Aneurinibacillus aneurinilyticus ATCC 12856 TaxID=649747 RepID=U1X0Z3_ANEAE|nr:response regulator transcription factor [Aneurinibacillus aneurinilyticus]ERI08650.1 response regulator ArlR [Aneurinibacillus aneurinilyticus ATCC 12856]MED0708445.1 response regulator transcription factor [Aneurinibacillus aneurinilyticus]MED0723235.1 response regulator transcription factor [Aneurinibacillus aneurinilyticus]MED0732942.1 response regulator transcription factor [Aneurinibacillus aneurinilyticus]MED0739619.1 response regulator transcription factor [Aneurinibacillus aneurinil
MRKILIIEDEENLSRFIELELQYEGFSVGTAYDGRSGLEKALNEEWDMILLDLMLPSLNGIEVCRRIRQTKHTPIIMLTARTSVLDRVSGLDSGADDYITKPLAIEELLARMRALFRRMDQQTEKIADSLLNHKNIEVNTESQTVKRDGEIIALTKREYELLTVLLRNMNRVMTRDLLLDLVWGYDSAVETNIVDVYVRYLRNKLDMPGQESIIQTVRGTGYVIRKTEG